MCICLLLFVAICICLYSKICQSEAPTLSVLVYSKLLCEIMYTLFPTFPSNSYVYVFFQVYALLRPFHIAHATIHTCAHTHTNQVACD